MNAQRTDTVEPKSYQKDNEEKHALMSHLHRQKIQ